MRTSKRGSAGHGGQGDRGYTGYAPGQARPSGLPPLPSKTPPLPPGGVPSPSCRLNPSPYRSMTRHSSSTSALPCMRKGKLVPLHPVKRGDTLAARTEDMASTEPSGRPLQASSVLVALALRAEEVLRVGLWSVRKLPENPEIPLVYLNEEEGRVEVEPPQEVLDELHIDDGSPTAAHLEATEPPEHEAWSEERDAQEDDGSPVFRRIILGAKAEVPLRMARDILDAVREDLDLFEQVQERFSESPEESCFRLDDSFDEELATVALSMQPGEVSEVLGTEAGMQILLRVR
ncbi:unnamed protein product [Symbiodinium necroappetens]|uniref:PpiC domain-containing protein n=1 Tax=Symbiodinium necroappetens TaxID=1628268 RepID=A0A813B0K7_9DINO|nr:unnamed protein product [Symbiodinium sp. KB8]CAE7884224.1 unnamed protein product [Symbiodinium necroappetens]